MVKKRLNKLKMVELSAVDKPAQEHALAVIMKRDVTIQKDMKKAVLTLPDDTGHSHIIWLDSNISESSYSVASGEEYGHSHPIQIIDGEVRIGESAGHTHLIDSDELSIMLQTIRMMESFDKDDYDVVSYKCRYGADFRKSLAKSGGALEDGSFPIMDSNDLNVALKAVDLVRDKEKVICHILKRANDIGEAVTLSPVIKDAARGTGVAILEDVTMSGNQNPADNEAELKKKVDTLEDELKKARAFGDLTDEEKEHYKSLDEKGKEDFLKKSADSRKLDIEKSKSANPVVYTTDDGTEFYKRDDPRLIAMAKARDADRRELEKARKHNEEMEFQKRAETELAHMPGDIKTRAAILKAVESIEDADIKKSAIEALRSNDADMAKAFNRVGSSNVNPDLNVNDAGLQLEKMAKEYAEKNKVGYFEAYDAVSASHPDLLEKALG